MPRWPLLLPLPAVSTSTSPSRSPGSSSSIVVESPSHRPSPSSCHRGCTVPCCCAAPSITLNLPLRRTLPLIAVVLSVHRRHAHAVPRQRGAVAPSLAVKEPLCHPLPSPLRSHRAVPCRQGAAAPSLTVEEPLRHPLPSRSRRAVPCHQGLTTPATCHAPPRPLVRMVVALPLLTPPPTIFRRLSLRYRLSFEVIFRVVVSFVFFHVYVD